MKIKVSIWKIIFSFNFEFFRLQYNPLKWAFFLIFLQGSVSFVSGPPWPNVKMEDSSCFICALFVRHAFLSSLSLSRNPRMWNEKRSVVYQKNLFASVLSHVYAYQFVQVFCDFKFTIFMLKKKEKKTLKNSFKKYIVKIFFFFFQFQKRERERKKCDLENKSRIISPNYT